MFRTAAANDLTRYGCRDDKNPLRESPRMSVQRSLVPPVLDDDEVGEEKTCR